MSRRADSILVPLFPALCLNNGYPAVPTGTPTPDIPPPWDYSAWTTEELYNISWGQAGAQAYPQIFHPTWVRNWYAVKRWSIDSDLDVMHFEGEMSECQSSPCASQQQQGVYFTPLQAWQLLWQEVNADPDGEMHQDLNQSTDTTCSNASTLAGCAP